jgi:FMN phosphatase YigB (HAD superfamily)
MATERRIAWAGLSTSDFELYTTYENSRFCKPNPDYYRDVMQKMGVCPEECLMVGNDVAEDMIAAALGARVFLLTDCLINSKNADISIYPRGSYNDLIAFIKNLSKDE